MWEEMSGFDRLERKKNIFQVFLYKTLFHLVI